MAGGWHATFIRFDWKATLKASLSPAQPPALQTRVCVCLLYFLGPTCFQWENLMLIIVKRFGFVLIRWPNSWVKSNFLRIWWFWHQLLGPCFWSWFEWYIHPGGWKTQYFLYQQSKEGRSLSWLSSDVDPTSGWPLTSWTIGYRKWLDLPTKPLKTLL